MVPPRTRRPLRTRSAGPSQTRAPDLDTSRFMGRPVTGPSPGWTGATQERIRLSTDDAVPEAIQERHLALDQLRPRLVQPEPGGPVDLREFLHPPGPRRPLHAEGVA